MMKPLVYFVKKMNKDQRGFSIVNVIAGIGISGVLLVSTSFLLQQTFTMQNTSNVQNELDGLQMVLMHQAKNIDYLIDKLALTEPQKKCLSRQQETGVDCDSVLPQGPSSNQYYTNMAISEPDIKTSHGITIKRTLGYVANCTLTACASITFRIKTEPVGGNISNVRARESSFTLPAYMFGETGQFKFDCSQLSGVRYIVTGIEMSTLDGRCDPLDDVGNCSGRGPIESLAPNLVCRSPVTPPAACTFGYSSLSVTPTGINCFDTAAAVAPTTPPVTGTVTCAEGNEQTVCSCDPADLHTNSQTLVSQGYTLAVNQTATLPTCTPGVVGSCRVFKCQTQPAVVNAPLTCIEDDLLRTMSAKNMIKTEDVYIPNPATPAIPPTIFSHKVTLEDYRRTWIGDVLPEVESHIGNLKKLSTLYGNPTAAEMTELEADFANFKTRNGNYPAPSLTTIVKDKTNMRWNFYIKDGTIGPDNDPARVSISQITFKVAPPVPACP